MEKFINTYIEGMNKDVSPNKYSNKQYYDLKNMRLITDDSAGLSSGSLVNIKGNSLAITLPDNGTILGSTQLRGELILFVKGDTSDKIYKIPKTSLSTAQDLTLRDNYYFDEDINGYDSSIDTLVYSGTLNFSDKIKAVANYENEYIQKVYWVDGINTLKHINLVYNENTNNLETLDESMLDILPPHIYGQLGLSLQIGGNLKAGKVQYAYQLYTPNGSETMYSPASDLLNITKETDSSTFDKQAGGSDIETVSGKSVQVEVTLGPDYINFSRIRLVALDYYGLNEIPSVRIINESEVTSDVINITDYGYSIGSLVLEEFRFLQNNFIPSTLTTKKNNLYIGNITEEFFDLDESGYIDTRAYRTRETDAGVVTTVNVQDYALPTVTYFNITHNGSAWTITFSCLVDEITNFIELIKPIYGEYSGGTYNNYLEVTVDPTGINDLILLDISDPDTYTISHDTLNNLVTIDGHWWIYPPTSNGPSDFYDIPAIHSHTVTLEAISLTYTKTETIGSPTEQCILGLGLPSELPVVLNDTWSIGSTNDCINTYNNLENDIDENHQFIYYPGTATTTKILGGKGKILSYQFADNVPLNAFNFASKDSYPFLKLDSTYPGYFDNDNIMNYTGHQRDEVYRYGIEFYDLKGRKSFPKWIGDIRFPNMEQSEFNGTNLIMSPLGITFTLNWSQYLDDGSVNPLWSIKDQISGYRILRAPREDTDKTIKAQGVVNPVGEYQESLNPDVYYPGSTLASGAEMISTVSRVVPDIQSAVDLDTHIVNFISPQIDYNKYISDNGSSFLEIVGYLDNVTENNGNWSFLSSYAMSAGSSKANDLTPSNRWDTRQTISSRRLLTPIIPSDTSQLIIDSVTVSPYITLNSLAPFVQECLVGSSYLIELDNAWLTAGIPALATGNKGLLVNYRVYLGYSQYGGADYSSRSLTSYIPAGEFVITPVGSSSVITMFNGDTYICNHTHINALLESDLTGVTPYSGQTVFSFAVETPINLAYKNDPLLKYINFTFSGGYEDYYALQETETLGVELYPSTYPTEIGDLYRYNSAYSAYDRSHVSIPQPFDFRLVTTYDARIYASDNKFPGEYSDSWLNFKASNYRDLEGTYGSLTRIINHKDKLVYFQDKAVGVIASYDREVVSTESNQKLALGTGGLLERYDYIDTASGTSIHDAIVPTGGTIMFYDDILKQFRMITNAIEPTSEIKGLKSYLNDAQIDDIVVGYDYENREVLFTPTNIQTPTTVFSGFLNAFTGFYELSDGVTPLQQYLPLDELLLSTNDNNTIYLHNVGGYGVFYDSTPKVSSVSLIINPLQIQPITYHVASWLSSVNSPEIVDETLDTLRITNTYQDTGVITLVPGTNITRRLRTWRINELRDSISEEGRLRDSFVKLDLGYNNTNDYKLTLSDIVSTYRPTKIR